MFYLNSALLRRFINIVFAFCLAMYVQSAYLSVSLSETLTVWPRKSWNTTREDGWTDWRESIFDIETYTLANDQDW